MAPAGAAGLFITYLPAISFSDQFTSATLRRILIGVEDPAHTSWIVYPDRRFPPRMVDLATDHIIEGLGDRASRQSKR